MSMNLDPNSSFHPKSILVPNFRINMTPKEFLNGCLQVCEVPSKDHPYMAPALRLLAPRRYRIPHGYWNHRKFLAMLILMSKNADLNLEHMLQRKKLGQPLGHMEQKQKQDLDMMTVGSLGCLMEGLALAGGSTYFVANDFAEAMSRSRLKDSLKPAEMQFACSAATLVLPEDFSRNFFGVFVPWISYAWLKAEQLPDNVWLQQVDRNKQGHLFICFGYLTPGDKEVKLMLAQIPGQDPLERIFGEQGILVEEGECGDAEHALRTKVERLVLQLILGMSAIPQMIDEPILERPKKIKHGVVVRDELWAPRYLGFKYKHPPKPTAGSGTHASPIMHRRDGHWTNQPHGPGRTLRKQIWIDECWVCVPDEEKENAK